MNTSLRSLALALSLCALIPASVHARLADRNKGATERAAYEAGRTASIVEFQYQGLDRFRLVAQTPSGREVELRATGSTRTHGVETFELLVDGQPNRNFTWFDEQMQTRVFHWEGNADGYLLPDSAANRGYERGLVDLLVSLDPAFAADGADILGWRETDRMRVNLAGPDAGGGSSATAPAAGGKGGGLIGTIIGFVGGLLGGGGGGGDNVDPIVITPGDGNTTIVTQGPVTIINMPCGCPGQTGGGTSGGGTSGGGTSGGGTSGGGTSGGGTSGGGTSGGGTSGGGTSGGGTSGGGASGGSP